MYPDFDRPFRLSVNPIFSFPQQTVPIGGYLIPANVNRFGLYIFQNANNQLFFDGIGFPANTWNGSVDTNFKLTWWDYGDFICKAFSADNVGAATNIRCYEVIRNYDVR